MNQSIKSIIYRSHCIRLVVVGIIALDANRVTVRRRTDGPDDTVIILWLQTIISICLGSPADSKIKQNLFLVYTNYRNPLN